MSVKKLSVYTCVVALVVTIGGRFWQRYRQHGRAQSLAVIKTAAFYGLFPPGDVDPAKQPFNWRPQTRYRQIHRKWRSALG